MMQSVMVILLSVPNETMMSVQCVLLIANDLAPNFPLIGTRV
jgi:hypothetical protein